jgi:potassium efflux system protein
VAIAQQQADSLQTNVTQLVSDIGIRATRLADNEGAEIVVPNGTILSGNLINWTLSNSQISMEINLKIMLSSKVSIAKELISQTLSRVQALSGSRSSE